MLRPITQAPGEMPEARLSTWHGAHSFAGPSSTVASSSQALGRMC